MAEQNEKDSVQTTSGSGEHREKDLSIMDYSKTYGGISKRFSNVANEKMETPKPVAIGRVLIGLMAMLLIWAVRSGDCGWNNRIRQFPEWRRNPCYIFCIDHKYYNGI